MSDSQSASLSNASSGLCDTIGKMSQAFPKLSSLGQSRTKGEIHLKWKYFTLGPNGPLAPWKQHNNG